MEKVTREVVADLWPLYVSGEASADTRRLVEAFLKDDPEFAAKLGESAKDALAACAPPALAPDHELKTLERVKRRLRGPVWLLQLAIIFTCFAFGRIVADTSFDVSPRNFIIVASIAVCFWTAFFVALLRGRKTLVIGPRRAKGWRP